MTEQPASQGPTATLPPQSANGTSPQLPPAPSPTESRRMHTRISGMRTSLVAGVGSALLMGTARITQLRQIIRRNLRKPPAS